MRHAQPLTRVLLWVLLAVAAAVTWRALERPLANPDDARYSAIAREMAGSGDWVTPRLNGLKYLEKPPLQYWASAASLTLFGETERAARAYTALAALAALLLVGYTARRLWDTDTRVAAVLALLASPYYLVLGTTVTLDMGLTLWTTLTFCAYLLAGRDDARPASRRRWLLVAWAAMALAVLSKGLVGIVFPAAALVLLCLVRGSLAPLARLEWAYGSVLFLAIAAPWFIAVSFANPEFPEFFFVHEHFQRFLTTAHRRTNPWWFYIPILLLGFLPWMLALPAALIQGWRREAQAHGQALRFAILWSAFIVVFFSLSGSKLEQYLLPAFPPLALVLGRYLATAPPRRLALWTAPVMLVALVLGAAAWISPSQAREDWVLALRLQARPWALAAAAILFVASAVGTLLLRRGHRWAALVGVALAMILVLACVAQAFERFLPRQSGHVAAQEALPWIRPDTRLYSVRLYDYSFGFYTRRAYTLVDYVDEFATGLRAEPQRALPDLAAFAADWRRPGDALAIMQPGTFDDLRELDLPMQLLHKDARRIVVRKP